MDKSKTKVKKKPTALDRKAAAAERAADRAQLDRLIELVATLEPQMNAMAELHQQLQKLLMTFAGLHEIVNFLKQRVAYTEPK